MFDQGQAGLGDDLVGVDQDLQVQAAVEGDRPGRVELDQLALQGQLLDEQGPVGDRPVDVAVLEEPAAPGGAEEPVELLEDGHLDERGVVEVEVDPAPHLGHVVGVGAVQGDLARDLAGGRPLADRLEPGDDLEVDAGELDLGLERPVLAEPEPGVAPDRARRRPGRSSAGRGPSRSPSVGLSSISAGNRRSEIGRPIDPGPGDQDLGVGLERLRRAGRPPGASRTPRPPGQAGDRRRASSGSEARSTLKSKSTRLGPPGRVSPWASPLATPAEEVAVQLVEPPGRRGQRRRPPEAAEVAGGCRSGGRGARRSPGVQSRNGSIEARRLASIAPRPSSSARPPADPQPLPGLVEPEAGGLDSRLGDRLEQVAADRGRAVEPDLAAEALGRRLVVERPSRGAAAVTRSDWTADPLARAPRGPSGRGRSGRPRRRWPRRRAASTSLSRPSALPARVERPGREARRRAGRRRSP